MRGVIRYSVQRCSFCGRDASEVRRLVAGVGVYICDACVSVAGRLMEADDGSAPTVPEWAGMSDEDLLAHLPRIASLSENVEAGLRDRVADLRARGVSWARIGEALGMSRQSAWERFSTTAERRSSE